MARLASLDAQAEQAPPVGAASDVRFDTVPRGHKLEALNCMYFKFVLDSDVIRFERFALHIRAVFR